MLDDGADESARVSRMATWDDVHRLALALPETMERVSRQGLLAWDVRDKTFAWERPLRRVDLDALGDAAPQGPILAARVPDLGAKQALLAELADHLAVQNPGVPRDDLLRVLVDREKLASTLRYTSPRA